MKVSETGLPCVMRIEPDVFGDTRGFFYESWSASRYAAAGFSGPFVQDNVSQSSRGSLRGLHLQHPHGQGKLVYVLVGEVFDVAVDVRVGSPHFGQWGAVTLSESNRHQLYIPPGFAHGFCVVSDTGAGRLQVYGALLPRGRDHRGMERSGHRNPLAHRSAHAQREGQGGPNLEGA